MQDMKLVELVNAAREEAHRDNQALRAEVRQDLAALRRELAQATLGMVRKLVWAVVVLGLALGGKDLLTMVFHAIP